MAEVKFDHVTRIYPGNTEPSVDDLNMEIKDGEFLVLVGPSGCGKSTTLRMLAGLEEVNQGSIMIGDTDVTNMQPKDRDIAMVFQNYALYPHMTVADNMGFALKIAGTPKAEIRKRVEEAAKILDLTEYLDRKPKALSGGQRQRVAMGRAIVRKPKVFLMDEPLSNLDAKLRVQTRTQIAALQRQLGVTTLYVTHDQTEAMTLADRIVIMSATKNPAGTGTIGRVEQIGSPQEVYRNPVNKFVAGFIGSPAMNFITVTLEGNEIVASGLHLTVPEGTLKVLREKGYDGKKLIFGIRPEDINTEPAFLETFPDSVVHATISVSELLGSESHLYCQVGDSEFIARVDARDYSETGAGIDLGFDLNKAHFFDFETEKTVY